MPAEQNSLMRANWAKFSVGHVKRLEPGARDRVLNRLGPGVRKQIREAAPLAWIPAELFLDVCQALHDELGPEGAHAYWRRNLSASMTQPFIRPLVDGSLFLFGNSPAALIRRTPQAWKLVSRNCADWTVDADDSARKASVRLEGLTEVFRRHLGFVHVVHGGLAAVLDTVRATGHVEAHTEAYGEGRFTLDVTWD